MIFFFGTEHSGGGPRYDILLKIKKEGIITNIEKAALKKTEIKQQ
jgi:hypothetical protein